MRYHSCIHNTTPAKWLQMLAEVELGGKWGQNEKVGSDTERSLALCVKEEWKFKGPGAGRLEWINLSLTFLTLRLLVYMLCGMVIRCLKVFALQSVWRLHGYGSVVDQIAAHQKMPLKCPSHDLPISIERLWVTFIFSLSSYALGHIHEPDWNTIHTIRIFLMAIVEL